MEFEGQYLTYQEYTSLGGTLDQTPFNLYEFEARKIVDKYTFGRLIDLDTQLQETKTCVFNLINSIEQYGNVNGKSKNVASESIDGYSVTYSNGSKEFIEAESEEYKRIVNTYLVNCKLEDGTRYLYRGVR